MTIAEVDYHVCSSCMPGIVTLKFVETKALYLTPEEAKALIDKLQQALKEGLTEGKNT